MIIGSAQSKFLDEEEEEEEYDEVYAAFLYLNERMGAFTKKEPY